MDRHVAVTPPDPSRTQGPIGTNPVQCSKPDNQKPRTNKTNKKGPTNMASAAVQRIKRKLPERIAQVRGDRSQRQFARDLGVFQQNVNRYENGTTPHTDFLITLATKEKISLDWLLLGKGRMRRR
jgi:ribosome-binding protein aMBF1 (putative translation factor)